MYATVFEGENGIPKDRSYRIMEAKWNTRKNHSMWIEIIFGDQHLKQVLVDHVQNSLRQRAKLWMWQKVVDQIALDMFCRSLEFGFHAHRKDESGNFVKLNQTNIDTGTGFESLICFINKVDSAYETDLFDDIIKEIQELSGKQYNDYQKEFRIIADHSRSACFLIADGVMPSNVGQGYVLRRILRRAIRYGQMLGCNQGFLIPLSDIVIKKYKLFILN